MKWIGRLLNITIILFVLWAGFSSISHQWNQPKDRFDHTLKVITYNTHGMMIGESIAKKKKMLNYINHLNADVVCLQEVLVYKNPQRFTLPALREAMREYPYTYYDFKRYNSKRQFGNVVFSRYPLINKQTIRYPSESNISSQCDIVVHQDTLRLIVNHLESYGIEKGDLHLDSLSVESIKNSDLNQKLRSAGQLRQEQAKTVRSAIRQSPYPVIALGDFNAIPLSYVYWKIRGSMHDCFLHGSLGQIGNTYKKGPFGIRIDYILCSRQLTPIKSEVDRVPYSDHFPVCATIGW